MKVISLKPKIKENLPSEFSRDLSRLVLKHIYIDNEIDNIEDIVIQLINSISDCSQWALTQHKTVLDPEVLASELKERLEAILSSDDIVFEEQDLNDDNEHDW